MRLHHSSDYILINRKNLLFHCLLTDLLSASVIWTADSLVRMNLWLIVSGHSSRDQTLSPAVCPWRVISLKVFLLNLKMDHLLKEGKTSRWALLLSDLSMQRRPGHERQDTSYSIGFTGLLAGRFKYRLRYQTEIKNILSWCSVQLHGPAPMLIPLHSQSRLLTAGLTELTS